MLKFYSDDTTSASVTELINRIEEFEPTSDFRVNERSDDFFSATFSSTTRPSKSVADIAQFIANFGAQIQELVHRGVSVEIDIGVFRHDFLIIRELHFDAELLGSLATHGVELRVSNYGQGRLFALEALKVEAFATVAEGRRKTTIRGKAGGGGEKRLRAGC